MLGLTRSAAAEVVGTGVTVNAVCPGFVDTEMTQETIGRIVTKTGRSRDEALAAALASAGQSRLISADEVAGAVVSLAAIDAADPPNGEALVLDGRNPMSGRFAIVNPEELGAPRGWNNGMLTQAGGRMLFIAGQTARDSSGRVAATDFVSQFNQALGNVLAVLRQAGGEPSDIGRFTIYVTDIAAYRASLKPLGETYRRRMGTHFPAMALVEVTSLVDPEAVVEIEATAVLS
jgi:enamine deaminase RidA (YjgF/YER057c/UK114 family)